MTLFSSHMLRNGLPLIAGRSYLIVLLGLGLLDACRHEEAPVAQSSSSSPSVRTEEHRNAQGALILTESFYIDSHGQKVLHGPQVRWSDGRKYQEVNNVNGEHDGVFTEWDPVFGYKAREGRYTKGRKDGRWLDWDAHGNVVGESFYEQGVPVGRCSTWHSPGKNKEKQKQSMCVYKDGHIDGEKVYWNEKGTVIRNERYDASGNLREVTAWYDNGRKEYHGFYSAPKEDGSLHLFERPAKDGAWTYWNNKGEVTAEGAWKDGKPWDGVCGAPVAGDAGSAGGLEWFGLYKDGKLIERRRGPK